VVRVARIVLFASAVGPAASFVRNVILARLLGIDDFAVSVIILAIAAMSDILSDMGWEKYLVSHRSGDDQATLQVVHFAKLWTGLIVCAAIAALSPFVATWIDRPDTWPAFAMIGVVTLLRALYRADYKLCQRNLDFSKEGRVEGLRGLADLAGAALFAFLLQSYWATVLGLICGALAGATASHAIRTFRYQPRWTPEVGRPLLGFGLPLLANNVLIFLIGQGDRLAVGFGSPAVLVAAYGASLTLLAGPQAVINRMLSSTALPFLSAAGDDRLFDRRYALVGRAAVLASAGITFPVIAFGPWLVALIFGPSFVGPAGLIELLAIAQGIQLLRSWPVGALVAKHKTTLIPVANVFRLVGVALAALSVAWDQPLWMVPASLIVGEVLGLGCMLFVLRRALRRNPGSASAPLLFLGLTWALAALYSPTASFGLKLTIAFLPPIILLGVFIWGARRDPDFALGDLSMRRQQRGRSSLCDAEERSISE